MASRTLFPVFRCSRGGLFEANGSEIILLPIFGEKKKAERTPFV